MNKDLILWLILLKLIFGGISKIYNGFTRREIVRDTHGTISEGIAGVVWLLLAVAVMLSE